MELVLFFIKGLHLITILGWSSPKISIAYFIGLEDEQKEGRKEGGKSIMELLVFLSFLGSPVGFSTSAG